MEPLNRADRNNAFLNFLLLFLLTVAVMLAVVFFSIKVPFRQNEQLRERIARMEKEREVVHTFSLQMRAAMDEMAAYETSKAPDGFTRQNVQFKIDKLYDISRQASDGSITIYDLIVKNLNELNTAKDNIRRLNAEKGYVPNQ